MADTSYSLGSFRPNSAGISEVFRSAGMQSALREAASSLCDEANSSARLSHDRKVAPEYVHGVDVLRRTAVGYVATGNAQAAIDHRAYILLKRGPRECAFVHVL